MFGAVPNTLGVSRNKLPYAVQGALPELVADFNNSVYRSDGEATDFDTLFTFARASTATYVDSTGTLQTAASGEARTNHHVYEGGKWVNKGLLIESEARTNLLTYSEEFDNAAWTKAGGPVGITANQTIAPDGVLAADLMVPNGLVAGYVVQTFTATSGTTYTQSVFAKSEGLSSIVLLAEAARFGGSVVCVFDLSAGTAGAVTGGSGTASIQHFGSGWYRVSLTVTATSTGNGNIQIRCPNAGDGTSGVYIWGAQLEEGSTSSSYIPTSGSTATRAAETLSIPAAKLPYPEPVVIGPELVTNGDGESAVGWAAARGGEAVSSTGGRIRVTSDDGTAMGVSQAISGLTIGGVYKITLEGFNGTVGGVSNRIGTNQALSLGLIESTGLDLDGIYVATAETMYVGAIAVPSAAGEYIEIDNISVREIQPLAVSIAMEGEIDYSDRTGTSTDCTYYSWAENSNNKIVAEGRLDDAIFIQSETGTTDFVIDAAYGYGLNVPYNIASRHGSTFINGAVDGTALTENTAPTALPDLSTTDLDLAPTFMGTIKSFRMWGQDVTDAGIEEASK